MPIKFFSTLSDYKLQYLKEFEQRNKHLTIPTDRLFKAVENTLSKLKEPISWSDFKNYYDGSHWQEIDLPDEKNIVVNNSFKNAEALKQNENITDKLEILSPILKSEEIKDVEILYLSGYEYFKDTRFIESEKAFKGCIEKGYEMGSSYEFLGRIKFEQQQYTDAINLFSRSIEVHPYNCQTFALRGHAKEKSGDISGYINDLEKAKQVYGLNHPLAKEHSQEMDELTLGQCGRTFIENCNYILGMQQVLIESKLNVNTKDSDGTINSKQTKESDTLTTSQIPEKSAKDMKLEKGFLKTYLPYLPVSIVISLFYYWIQLRYSLEALFNAFLGPLIMFYTVPFILCWVVTKLLYRDFPKKLYRIIVAILLILFTLALLGDFFGNEYKERKSFKEYQEQYDRERIKRAVEGSLKSNIPNNTEASLNKSESLSIKNKVTLNEAEKELIGNRTFGAYGFHPFGRAKIYFKDSKILIEGKQIDTVSHRIGQNYIYIKGEIEVIDRSNFKFIGAITVLSHGKNDEGEDRVIDRKAVGEYFFKKTPDNKAWRLIEDSNHPFWGKNRGWFHIDVRGKIG